MNNTDPKIMLSKLRSRSLLGWTSENDLEELLEKFSFRKFPAGVTFEGEVGPEFFAIVVEGLVQLVSKDDSKGNSVFPGQSLELQANLFSTQRSYRWVAAQDSTIGLINFETFKGYLEAEENFEYLKRISSVVALQKFKGDLQMLGLENQALKKIILSLVTAKDTPQENDLCVVASGSVIIGGTGNGQQGREFKISDYILWNIEDLPFKCSEDFSFWRLPSSSPALSGLEKSIVNFFDVCRDIRNKKNEEFGVDEANTLEEPDESIDFEIPHFYKAKSSGIPKRRRPVAFKQHDAMDCGAACMSMISHYYKRSINISTWRRLIHVTREGASMYSIKKGAEEVGFDAIGIMSGVKSLKKFSTPFIALMAYHYVVVYSIDEAKVIVADPAQGLLKLPLDEFSKDYSQNCLLLLPNKKLKSYPESPPAYKKYLSLFRPHVWDILQLIAFSTVLFFLNLFPPLFMQYTFDVILPYGLSDSMKTVALVAIALAIVISSLMVVRASFVTKIASVISLKLSSLFFRQVLRLPFGYFAVRNVGDITTRVDELERIRDFFTGTCVQAVLNIIAIGVYGGILYLYSPYFTFLIGGTLILTVVVMSPLFSRMKNQMQEVFYAMGSATSVVYEQFNGLRTIQNISGSLQARWRWEEHYLKLLDRRRNIQKLSSITGSVSALLQRAISLSFLTLAIYLFLEREITIGQVVAAAALSEMIIGPLVDLVLSVDEFSQMKISFEKVDEIITTKVENESQGLSFPENFQLISFKNIWFKYGGDISPWILKGVNLDIRRGEKIAFVGPSGAGKSTLSYMLNLIYEPQKGEIFFGDIQNSGIDLSELRDKVTMIVQDSSILSGTVLSNIALGDPNPNYVRAMEAAQVAEAHDFILTLPQGYETLIGGEHGVNMSGGQKQRISIARAIYKKPSVIIMDEATSALDTVTEKKVLNNIKNVLEHTTCFIIAHRFNTVSNVDRIVVFKDGKIQEQGNHRDLMKRQGIYYGMFRMQMGL